MTTQEALTDLRSRILSRYTLLFLQTYEEERWKVELSNLALELQRGLVVWSITAGAQPLLENVEPGTGDPLEFLLQVEQYPTDHLFFVKDFHPYLTDPRVIRKLRDMAPGLIANRKTLLFVGPVAQIPLELQKEAVGIELPLPGMKELGAELKAVLDEHATASRRRLHLSDDIEDRLLKAVLGLTAQEARKALARSILGREEIDDDVFKALVSEKRRLVQGSDLLQFYDLQEGVKDVGGLEGLKDWLAQRAEAFSTKAREQGIPTPKGVFLLGVQGCGKSLTARVAARLLSFPLVRLDAANLLSSDRGSSEKNMREVLNLMETIAPAVLWLDEIEKGFAGTDADGASDATMTRLVGGFLTWMEEHRAPVFVIATANSVAKLPPEMLRRGRFDELFFVDLPNFSERKQVLQIHLSKRGWKPENYDVDRLANQTEGYSGAELESVVVSAMLDAYGKGRTMAQDDLELARDQLVPLSVTMGEKIFELREWALTRCRRATPDSRVTQMLEEETRQGAMDIAGDEPAAMPEWEQLAEQGQLNAALVEFVRCHDHVAFSQIQEAFSGHLETAGEQGLALRSDPNVVLWLGLSPELAEALSKLIAGKRLYVHAASADVYRDLGKTPRLPPLERLAAERIAKPAWYPAEIRIAPSEDGNPRLASVARIKLNQ